MEWIYGRQVVRLALADGARRRPRRIAGTVHALQALGIDARRAALPVETLHQHALDELAGSRDHQGVAALVEPYPYVEPEELFGDGVIVALDEVADPRNLGAVARSALASGAAGLAITKRNAAAVTPAAVKASAGATEHLDIAQVQNMRAFLMAAQRAGAWVNGAAGDARESYLTVPYDGPLVLVLGAEGRGLRRLVAETCDRLVAIPMAGAVESLNVSVAAALLLYEARRARGAGRDTAESGASAPEQPDANGLVVRRVRRSSTRPAAGAAPAGQARSNEGRRDTALAPAGRSAGGGHQGTRPDRTTGERPCRERPSGERRAGRDDRPRSRSEATADDGRRRRPASGGAGGRASQPPPRGRGGMATAARAEPRSGAGTPGRRRSSGPPAPRGSRSERGPGSRFDRGLDGSSERGSRGPAVGRSSTGPGASQSHPDAGRKPTPGDRKPTPGGRKPTPGGRKPPPGGRKPTPGGRKPTPGGRKPPPGGRPASGQGGGQSGRPGRPRTGQGGKDRRS